ncbi:MAG: biotin--[acetyl-CoA-carboxylase] ligase [Candidatus Brocadiia bacterium]|nr:MAG: biotin--[acetyl-CoA-carboxylase] ligase [Candidatus Brocadiia bacterium]
MQKTDSLDPDKIIANLNTKQIGGKIVVFESTSSTNDVAAEYAKNRRNHGVVIFAEQQTCGRGRAGNKWLSGRADSILCSVVLTKCRCSCELLSLVTAVAVAETIGKIGGQHAKIKWPNDIISNNKKLAGILLESKRFEGNTVYVLGMGINCHQTTDSFPPELQNSAASIDIESGTVCDRITLAKRLLTCLDHWLETAEHDSKKVIDRWCRLSIQLGHRVTLTYNRKTFSGNCIGIDPENGLIMQLDRGGVRMFDAAHTSIAR